MLKDLLQEIALSEKEYRLIVHRLGREPNPLELGMFGGLWSEHCGYKHSKALLKLFPTRSKAVLISAGEENAGVVDLGEGLVAVMKMESHNHPSAIEPYQGAATGVGGIVRDIFTMGARPIALMNSLRFGPLSQPRNRYLFNGVVAGIAGYGNCLGIPNVGGEIFFSPAYSHNPLVNVLCLGLAHRDKLVRAQARGEGNPLLLVGAETGRDGLHGASGLASRAFEGEAELRTAVQVGNPFLEKVLLEACLELAEAGWLVGMCDLGAAGLTSAAVESASRGGGGLEIDVLKVPRREQGMTAYEVMLAESQERMLVIPRPGCEEKVRGVFRLWDLPCSVIGQVTGDGLARIKEGERAIAQVLVKLLTDPPLYVYQVKKPLWLKKLQAPDLPADLSSQDYPEVLLRLLASPNIASKEGVYRQYDHQVQVNTVIPPGADAALLRIQGTRKALALACDGNGRFTYLDPYQGGMLAVAEAARNVACVGARPLALTNCLNLGNPEKPDIYYQLKQLIRGMAHTCRVLGLPVISGNVSLYNETKGEAVYPTPVVGMAGLLEDVTRICRPAFRDDGDVVVLLGGEPLGAQGLGGSEYLVVIYDLVAGKPSINLDLEKRVQRCCLDLITKGIIKSAHDCSDGGLAVALAESCIAGGIGFSGEKPRGGLADALFGEGQSRIVVSLEPSRLPELEGIASHYQVPVEKLGVVGGDRFVIIRGCLDLALREIEAAWRGGLEQNLG